MKSYLKTSCKTFYILGIFLCSFTLQNTISGSTNSSEEENQNSNQNTIADANIVGIIGEYKITRDELEKRLLESLTPDPYGLFTSQSIPQDANSILSQMLGEKAVAIEARKQGLLKDETINEKVTTQQQKKLISSWEKYNINKEHKNITATEEEIQKQLEVDPNLDKDKVKSAIEKAKTKKILNKCLSELYKKSEIKKITENYTKLIKIHDRLLNKPLKPRTAGYIRDYQVKEELTEKEKNITLATFTHGKITLQQWFDALCDIAPPSRPKELNSETVEKLLERTIIKPLIASDALVLGLDKNPDFQRQMKDYENQLLIRNARTLANKDKKEPTEEDIIAFFNNNKEFFLNGRFMKIDQIWCKDLETAQLVKKEIDNGKDFDQMKKEYSLYPDSKPSQTSMNNEGFFWKEIWQGEPNKIIGPIKGFRTEGIKWRIVKIIEKQQGKEQEYSKELETTVKMLMITELSEQNMKKYCLETLKKYPYEIYFDKIKDIDPMNIQ